LNISSKDMGYRGKIGGYARAAKYGPHDLTGAARAGFLKRFEPQDPSLSEEERQRRTQAALKAYMAGLSRLSAISRQKHNGKKNQAGG